MAHVYSYWKTTSTDGVLNAPRLIVSWNVTGDPGILIEGIHWTDAGPGISPKVVMTSLNRIVLSVFFILATLYFLCKTCPENFEIQGELGDGDVDVSGGRMGMSILLFRQLRDDAARSRSAADAGA